MNVHCFGDVWNSWVAEFNAALRGWGDTGVTVGSLRSGPSVLTLWAGHLTYGGLNVPLDTVRGRGQVGIRILRQALGKQEHVASQEGRP